MSMQSTSWDAITETTTAGSSAERGEPPSMFNSEGMPGERWIENLSFGCFSVQRILGRQDVQIQADFKNGISVEFLDDRRDIIPIIEFKLP